MGNPFLGVFLHWCGGLASGSFYVPYKGVKKWSWEMCIRDRIKGMSAQVEFTAHR